MRSAGVLVVSAGRVLLCKRTQDGFWSVPGGIIEPGETPWRAAEREFREETRYRGALHTPRFLALTGDFALFEAAVNSPFSPVLDHEHSAAGWFSLRALPRPLYPGLERVLS